MFIEAILQWYESKYLATSWGWVQYEDGGNMREDIYIDVPKGPFPHVYQQLL